jgi:hypothetical protein
MNVLDSLMCAVSLRMKLQSDVATVGRGAGGGHHSLTTPPKIPLWVRNFHDAQHQHMCSQPVACGNSPR